MPAAKPRRTHPYSERYRIRRHDRCDRCGGGHRSHASSDHCAAITTCALSYADTHGPSSLTSV